MVGASNVLRLEGGHWAQMQAHVQRCIPQEACGLLAGLDGRVLAVYEIDNALHSPTRFRMDGPQQVSAFLEIEQRGWQLLAIYHSHPNGPPGPSPSDLAEFAYPGTCYLIWSPAGPGWQAGAFCIEDGTAWPAALQILPAE